MTAKTSSAIPAVHHLESFQGDDWVWRFDFSIDLTGSTITATLHRADGEADVPFTINEIDLEEGSFEITLPSSSTSEIPPGHHSWCLQIESPDETKRTYLTGRYIVKGCR